MICYKGHHYIKADFSGQRAGRRQLRRFAPGRLARSLWLAEKQRDQWRWSESVVGSTDQDDLPPTKLSWHPLSGETILTAAGGNHVDDINRSGQHPDHEYLRGYVWHDNGQTVEISPWNPLFEDLDHHDLQQLEDEIQSACFAVADHFKNLLEPLTDDRYIVSVQGCSHKY